MNKPIRLQKPKISPIIIEDNVWIGTSCIILKGVTIGSGSIIGAGSLVNRNIPPNEIWCGSPASQKKKKGLIHFIPLSSSDTKNIFVLRNNDLGDVLVCTPSLRSQKFYPLSSLTIGVGDWAKSLLEHNPSISEIIPCNAPWHNKQICRFPANSPVTFLQGLLYCLFHKESKYIAKKRFNHGIDILE